MPVKLSTTINHIDRITNLANANLIREFYHYMKTNGGGDKHINNNLKIVLSLEKFLNPTLDYEVITRQELIRFLDIKMKPIELDPDNKWITI